MEDNLDLIFTFHIVHIITEGDIVTSSSQALNANLNCKRAAALAQEGTFGCIKTHHFKTMTNN